MTAGGNANGLKSQDTLWLSEKNALGRCWLLAMQLFQ